MNIISLPLQLKSQTSSNHQHLEKLLMGQMRLVKSPEDYLKILSLFYGYFSGLEALINKFIGENQLTDYAKRRKTKSIANDIIYFRGNLPLIAIDDDLPTITNHLEAFGALYVIEGSTLGGSIISKIMRKQLNVQFGTKGFTFFDGYGNHTEEMWTNFKTVLVTLTKTEEENQLIIEAANETFLKFSKWINKNNQ